MTGHILPPLASAEGGTVDLIELSDGSAQLLVRCPGAGVVVATLDVDQVVELGRRCRDGGSP